MACDCDYCVKTERVIAIKKRGDADEMRSLIDELMNELVSVQSDNEIKSSILDGSWPTAKRWAERILEKVKAQEQVGDKT